MSSVCTVPADGYTVHALSMGTHTGTHVDAPYHFFADGKTLDEIDLACFLGRAVIVDVRHLALERKAEIGWTDVESALAAKLSEIGPRAEGKIDIVLFWTGWDAHWGTENYFAHPYFAKQVAEELRDSGVGLIGVDTLSPDETVLPGEVRGEGMRPEPQFDMHGVFLGAGRLICENLTNLGRLAAAGGDRGGDSDVWVSLMPLSIKSADGAPVRAYGWRNGVTGQTRCL
ncbi:putative cyclase [Leucogyrophana mollusca]|uniref:Cyclase n=1 Tax=Leucogyrophana mollusca TaxID=85980 RepID=A0ACB8BSM9_9AGAM|nr:putative cyclase [Leucogyrophana mollusca]